MDTVKFFDVIIIGGSYSGLSAAMALGRSLKKVLIIDSGAPCNRQTPHSHNFITHDGKKPAVIAEEARIQVLEYDTVEYFNGLAISGQKKGNEFEITTDAGNVFIAKKLIFATGVKDTMPDIPGFSECWGITVIHCPYCHGYEFRNKKTAIMANGERAAHMTPLIHNLTDSITILTSGNAEFSSEQQAKFAKHAIKIETKRVIKVNHESGHVKNLVFEDGSTKDFDAVYAAIPFSQHTDIPVSLGCSLTESGHLQVDSFQKTNIKGIFACGDNSSMMRSVAYAVATGNIAGAMANMEITQEEF